jgi:hypothetical protein
MSAEMGIMAEPRITGDICEMWSLPWHALHRSLALELVADAVGHSVPRLQHFQVPGAALCTNTWLSRARRSTASRQKVSRFATP